MCDLDLSLALPPSSSMFTHRSCLSTLQVYSAQTGTLTTEELVPAGVVNLADSRSKGKVRDASVESSLVLPACQALVPDGLTLTRDPIEVAALKGIGWQYDPNENTARPGAWAELLEKATSCKEEAEKLTAQKDAVPTAAEAKRFEARHEQKLKIAAAAEAEQKRSPSVPSTYCTGSTSLRGFNG